MSIIARDIHKIYKNGSKDVKAVNGVSVNIERGSTVAIIGPSGAGKSTLLHLLGGLDSPTSGDILLDGVDIYKLPDGERARLRNKRIGFVFQFYHLLPEFSALENVMMPALIKDHRRNKERASDILKSVGLGDRINHCPSELSGGEAQRVAIARALVNSPEILLCDEPTGNLDSKTREGVYELLFELKAKTNMTLIIVTHDNTISPRIPSVIPLEDGKIKI